MKEEFVSRQQLNLLPKRIWMAEETTASKELKLYLHHLFRSNDYMPLKIMVVGAGGSYAPAMVLKYLIHDEFHTPNVEATTPQTAIRIFTQYDIGRLEGPYKTQYDIVIAISYSGKTPDIVELYKVCLKKGYRFVLLTGAEKSTLNELYLENNLIKIISYFNEQDDTGRERGIISMFSALAPAIISYVDWKEAYQRWFKEGEKFVSELNISKIAETIKKFPVIHVFYEWDTVATALDIESKFIESGIANVVLHEKKNFSHSRWTTLYSQNFALVINLTRTGMASPVRLSGYSSEFRYKYDENLTEFLTKICEEKSSNYINFVSPAMMPTQWNIEIMTIIPYLITAIGEELGIDISKPLTLVPDEVLSLYKYKGKF